MKRRPRPLQKHLNRLKAALLAGGLMSLAWPALAVAAPLPAHPPDDTFGCLHELGGPLERIDEDFGYGQILRRKAQPGARFDARGMSVFQQTDPEPVKGATYPIDVRLPTAEARTCWAGGLVQNTNPYTISWRASKHPNNAAMILKEGYPIVDGIRIHNAHDGIRPWHRPKDGRGLSGFEVRNSWLSNIRDDCIENDSSASGLIEDTLFDGCYVFLSARGGEPLPGSAANIITIRNSLIRLKEMPEPYGHEDERLSGHGNLFKFDDSSPKLILENNIFLIENFPITRYGRESWMKNAPGSLSLRPERLERCSANTIVWLGPGRFPGRLPEDQDCARITTDKSKWDVRRDAWITAHPGIARIPGVDPD